MGPANHQSRATATSGASHPLPAPGEVRLWRLDLDLAEADRAALSDDERARADRLRTPELAHRFVAGRAFLRRTLAAHLGCTPEAVRFSYNAFGRPGLDGAPFDFNLSHSGPLALLAVAIGTVGVDVEHPDPDADLLDIGRQVMSPQELAAFEALPALEREGAFYALWTAKEAVIKALGTGFSRDARSLHTGWTTPLTPILTLADGGRTYHVQAIPLPGGAPAAVALDRPIVRLSGGS
jgi:4'-phosphopantetheinyl transferase